MCLISFLCVLCREAWGVFFMRSRPALFSMVLPLQALALWAAAPFHAHTHLPCIQLQFVACCRVKGRVPDCNMGHITDCHTAGQGV